MAMKTPYERKVRRQMAELGDGCIENKALPFLLICMDANKRGHIFWPDELPPEIVSALPALLDDVRESLQQEPLS